jgi:hypothetical protein
MTAKEHLEHLWDLLQLEKEEDLILFRKKVQALSLEERKS